MSCDVEMNVSDLQPRPVITGEHLHLIVQVFDSKRQSNSWWSSGRYLIQEQIHCIEHRCPRQRTSFDVNQATDERPPFSCTLLSCCSLLAAPASNFTKHCQPRPTRHSVHSLQHDRFCTIPVLCHAQHRVVRWLSGHLSSRCHCSCRPRSLFFHPTSLSPHPHHGSGRRSRTSSYIQGLF